MVITSILNYFKKLLLKDYQQKSAKEVSSDYFLIDDMSVTSMLAERVSTLDLADCEIWLEEYQDEDYTEYSIIGKT